MAERERRRSAAQLWRSLEDKPLFRRFPLYVWICLIAIYAVQMPAFSGTQIFLKYLPSHDLTTALDRAIPFDPHWIVIYYLSFVSWPLTALLIISENKTTGYRYSAAYILALVISAAVFLAYPCHMERAELTGRDLFTQWVRFTYWMDNPVNLFPSLHVLFSYFCWRGTWGCQRIPRWYKIFNFFFFLLVCCSVVLVKQHVLVDIPSAILVGEAALQLSRLLRLERIPYAIERAWRKRTKGE